jgi:hypothetical protein
LYTFIGEVVSDDVLLCKNNPWYTQQEKKHRALFKHRNGFKGVKLLINLCFIYDSHQPKILSLSWEKAGIMRYFTFCKKQSLMIPLQFSPDLFEGPNLLLLLLILVIWSIALVAVANGRFNDDTTKLCWFFIILFLNVLGVLLFVIWGRKEIYGKSNARAGDS